MGFSKKRKNKVNPFAEKKRQIKENGGRKPEQNNRTGEYRDLIRESAQFEKYYKHQKVCPPEEWDQFMDALKSNLPTTFRVTSCRGESEKLLEIVRDKLFVEALKEVNPDGQGEHLDPPKSISWYPNESAFQLQLSRKEIRRSEPLFRLHNFLISETSSGNISRQEAVSMIPPIVLDVKSHHKVLDMCAAPGSKTAQLIEALHGDLDGKVPAGFVLANDVDNNRCYMLVHQAKRLNSPSCLITNCDSAQFPQLFIPGEEQTYKLLKFDRVLCDVPCTGDGTMRKNPDIWMKWNIMQSLNLHGIQFRIARRGAELCEVGGRLVYSTCSLNPIENEAVLCRLLKECNGSLKIIDASANIKTLKYTEVFYYCFKSSMLHTKIIILGYDLLGLSYSRIEFLQNVGRSPRKLSDYSSTRNVSTDSRRSGKTKFEKMFAHSPASARHWRFFCCSFGKNSSFTLGEGN